MYFLLLQSRARNFPLVQREVWGGLVYIILFTVFLVYAQPPSGAFAQQQPQVKPVRSLLGKELKPIEFSPEALKRLTDNLVQAEEKLQRDPDNVDNLIWLGRRQAYLGRYYQAIDTYTAAIKRFPDDPRLYRHRGHRWITVRELDKAIKDFDTAVDLISNSQDKIEPDGQPNAKGIPTSSLFTNIYYHLGLAHYLKGDFASSFKNFERCHELATNNDMRIAALDWMYASLRRQGKHELAADLIKHVSKDLELIENFAYHRRILMYKGEIAPTDLIDPDDQSEDRALDLATYGYAIGNWHLTGGDTQQATKMFEQVIAGPYWPAFGYIAAEADLARMKRR